MCTHYDAGLSSFGVLLRRREGGSGGRVGGRQMELFSEKDRPFSPWTSPVTHINTHLLQPQLIASGLLYVCVLLTLITWSLSTMMIIQTPNAILCFYITGISCLGFTDIQKSPLYRKEKSFNKHMQVLRNVLFVFMFILYVYLIFFKKSFN